MFFPQMFILFVPVVTGLAGAAVLFLLLRHVYFSGDQEPTTASALRHSRTVGVLGWMASSLAAAQTFWGVAPAGGSNQSPVMLFVPVVLVLAIHIIGQLSHPGTRRRIRVADAQARRVGDFLPKRLAMTTAAVFLISAVLIASIVGHPATQPVTPLDRFGAPSSGNLSGAVTAVWLGSALAVLALGTAGVLVLMARRRQLTGLTSQDNAALRTLSMNRLLRTSATIASGLGAIATGLSSFPSQPGHVSGFVVDPGGALNVVVLLVMWWWPARPRVRRAPVPVIPALRWHRLAVLPVIPWGLLLMAVLFVMVVTSRNGIAQLLALVAGGLLFLLWNAWCARHIAAPSGVDDGGPRLPAPRRGTLVVAVVCGAVTLLTLLGAAWAVPSETSVEFQLGFGEGGRTRATVVVAGTCAVVLAVTALLTAASTARRILRVADPEALPGGPVALVQERWQRITHWTSAVLLSLCASVVMQTMGPEVSQNGSTLTAVFRLYGWYLGPVFIVAAIILWTLSGEDPAARLDARETARGALQETP